MSQVQEIEITRIQNSALNPRLGINPHELNELKQSILKVGILQPITLRPLKGSNNRLEVVIGQRRFLAAKEIGLKTMPAVVRNLSDDEVVELNLIENIQRAELSAVEKGRSCKELIKKYPLSYPNVDAVANKLGVSSGTIRNWLQLVDAPEEIQKMVAPSPKIGVPREVGKIDWDTAVSITTKIKDRERQVQVARELSQKPIYRREAREVISRVAKQPEKSVSTVVKEVVETPYEMPFRLTHMQPIINGTKTQTSRTGIADPKIKQGAIIHAAVWEPRFAELKVKSITRKRLEDFDEEDAKREGGYTLKQFKAIWRNLHGEWDENQSVYIINFERVK